MHERRRGPSGRVYMWNRRSQSVPSSSELRFYVFEPVTGLTDVSARHTCRCWRSRGAGATPCPSRVRCC
jgi:hypothetical protein